MRQRFLNNHRGAILIFRSACVHVVRILACLVALPFFLTYGYLHRTAASYGIVLVTTTTTPILSSRFGTNYDTNYYNNLGIYRQTTTTTFQEQQPTAPRLPLFTFYPDAALVSSWIHSPKVGSGMAKTLFFRQETKEWCMKMNIISDSNKKQSEVLCQGRPEKHGRQIIKADSGGQQKNNRHHNETLLDFSVAPFGMTAPTQHNKPTTNKQSSRGKAEEHHALGFRINPNKQQVAAKQPSPLSSTSTLLFQKPATLLLLALNIGLAVVYWNYRVPVSSVASLYSNMVRAPFEIWRCLSGSTAHFEIWHLGFNMMALYGQGLEMEGILFDSIAFLFYHLSLIPLTSILWLGLEYGSYYRRDSQQQQDERQRPTVGYSGVLFAWMVVAALEQHTTCPIPFLPDLCFSTHLFLGGTIKFSWGPLAQLVVAQVLLPRVSFTGHLAGIIAGFCLYWGLLPMAMVQPAVLVPTLFLFYLLRIRKVVPRLLLPPQLWRCSLLRICDFGSNRGNDEQQGQGHNQFQSEPSNDPMLDRLSILLLRIKLVIFVVSVYLLGPFSPLTLSFGCTVIFWLLCCCYNFNSSNDRSEGLRVMVRGYVVTAVLAQINDAMAVAAWMVLMPASMTGAAKTILLMSTFMTFRCGIFLGTIVTGTMMEKRAPENNGIMHCTLGWSVLKPAVKLWPALNSFVSGWGGGTLRTFGPDEPGRPQNNNNRGSGENNKYAGRQHADTVELGIVSNLSPPSPWEPFMGRGQRLGSGS